MRRASPLLGRLLLLLVNLVIAQLGVMTPRASAMAADHCYADLGCFPLSEEFYHPRHRPINVRPWHRSRIKTHFELYSRHAHPEGFILEPWDLQNLRESRFDPKLETKIIVPGWLDNVKRAYWLRELRDALLWKWRPINIIIVHWRNFTPYTIATANTRVVGAELANLLRWIESELGYNRAFYHLIGHSLGAHISGYAGDRISGLGRITALDPARPFFQHMPKSVRLDRADARFVDAIHSDFTPENAILLLMSFGMTTPVGHLDFYPNGPPLLQPGCLRDVFLAAQNGVERGMRHNSLAMLFLETIRYITACDHQRSHEWFIESITNRQCLFVGVRCNTFEGMINGRCRCDDSASSCAIMGIHADQMYVNNVHEDIWPKRRLKFRQTRPHAAPFNLTMAQMGDTAYKRPLVATPANPLVGGPQLPVELLAALTNLQPDEAYLSKLPHLQGSPMSRESILAQLRLEAASMRRPPEPQLVFDSETASDEQLASYLASLQDGIFLDYLRLFWSASSEPQEKRKELRRRSYDLKQAIGASGDQMTRREPSDVQMSDLERDIELWYEDESRWYLKTNSRPSYCVNQYQVLVYLGELRTSDGKAHLRANLVISIIGSHGELINQRFKPSQAKLDSRTMQPFFIILEGAYTLGSIKSAAISWEARRDPDPVQATVSFQSSRALEAAQALWPTYKARHPLLSATLKYDYSPAFSWRRRLRPQKSRRTRREVCEEHQVEATEQRINNCQPEAVSQTPNKVSLESLHHGESKLDVESSAAALVFQGHLSRPETLIKKKMDQEEEEEEEEKDELDEQPDYDGHQVRVGRPHDHLVEPIGEQRGLVAELHNLGVHLDRAPEDSIVIDRIWISPLMASYGAPHAKPAGRTFCPAHRNFRLARDQTARLAPSLMVDSCHFEAGGDHHSESAIRLPAMFAVL